MSQARPIIELINIDLKFKQKQILKNFSLKIYSGDKVVIFGPSGIGKSSLARLLLGVVQPQTGKVVVEGQTLTPTTVWNLRKKFAYVDQDASIGEGRVSEVIKDYFSFKANKKLRVTTSTVPTQFRKLDLTEEILTRDTSQLSGGERQRVALAIAFLLKRDILILDEATSGLDPALKEKVIKEVLAQKNQTLISITHDAIWQERAQVKLFDFKKKTWAQ